jgi:uncharacterized protein (TIGR02001 family)
MSTVLKRAALALGAVTMLLGTVRADDKALPFDVELGVDVFSHYMWRGMVVNEDPVVQPSVTVSKDLFGGTVAFNVWSSFDLTDFSETNGSSGHLQEIDYTLSYGKSLTEWVDFETGVIYYRFPGDAGTLPSTWEAYASFSFPATCFVTPSVTAYYDFDEVDGWYVKAALDREFAITEAVTLGLSTSVGYADADYNAYYFGVDDSAFTDLNFGASLSYQVTENFSVGISAGYTLVIDSDLRDAVNDEDKFYTGVSASFAF